MKEKSQTDPRLFVSHVARSSKEKSVPLLVTEGKAQMWRIHTGKLQANWEIITVEVRSQWTTVGSKNFLG